MSVTRFRAILPIVFAFASSAPAPASAEPPRYFVDTLDGLSIGTQEVRAEAIAADSQVVGSAIDLDDFTRAFYWPGAFSLVDLNLEDEFLGIAHDVNDAGLVVGRMNDDAFTWTESGGRVLLGPGSASGVNAAGLVVGSAPNADDLTVAVTWDDGIRADLPTLEPDFAASARDVNEAGVIVGNAATEERGTRPVRWIGGGIAELGSLGADPEGAVAHAINDDGTIVGTVRDPGNGSPVPVAWFNGSSTATALPALGGTGVAYDVNACGFIVGTLELPGGRDEAVIWIDGEVHILEDFVAVSQWSAFEEARDINDEGQIAVRGVRSGLGDWSGVLGPAITTVPPVPGSAGTSNTVEIAGARPGEELYVIFGFVAGDGRHPICALPLPIADPRLAAFTTADACGRASVTRFVPAAAAGRKVLIMAGSVDDPCGYGNLVTVTF